MTSTIDRAPLTAHDVREALHKKWPADGWLTIDEAPEDSMRQGRKLDFLAIDQWRSRGYELDGVEVKVSLSDWQRERKNAAKADWWFRHVHRFWVAVPLALSRQVAAELPTGWGLLAVNAAKNCSIAVRPVKHEAEPLPWEAVIGVMRAHEGTSNVQRMRERERWLEEGREQGKAAAANGVLEREYHELKATVEAFQAASGVDLAGMANMSTYQLERIAGAGRMYRALLSRWGNSKAEDLVRWVGDLEQIHRRIGRDLRELRAAAGDMPGAEVLTLDLERLG